VKESFMKSRVAMSLIALLCVVSPALTQESRKPQRAAGRVDGVTQESITIVLPGAEKMTLAVDRNTQVVGKGLGTKTRAMKEDGRAPAINDLVNASDSVVVTYVDAGAGQLRATEVNVRQAAK
jgi:hypothetical protein